MKKRYFFWLAGSPFYCKWVFGSRKREKTFL